MLAPSAIRARVEDALSTRKTLTPAADPRVLIVTALPEELAAVLAVCNQVKTVGASNDPTIYYIGQLEDDSGFLRSVLIATQGAMGKANASAITTNALRSFPSIQHIFMVGIAGGCPNPSKPQEHVRLGDVPVVSDAKGVFEYDHVKRLPDSVEHRGSTQKPSQKLLQAFAVLSAELNFSKRPWEAHFEAALVKLEGGSSFKRPDDVTDILYVTTGRSNILTTNSGGAASHVFTAAQSGRATLC